MTRDRLRCYGYVFGFLAAICLLARTIPCRACGHMIGSHRVASRTCEVCDSESGVCASAKEPAHDRR